MKWLVLAIIILAQQPTKAPEGKGTAESNNAQSAAHAKSTESKQGPSAQPSPVPTQATVGTESERSGTTTPNHTGTSNQQTSDEDRAIQRKLTLFTGVLASVGVLQLVVMFLTWLVYRRQAGIMEQQRATMQSQRTLMQGQLGQMEKQTAELQSAQETALIAARAAVVNAKAAKVSADIAAGVSLPVLKISQFGIGPVNVSSNLAFFRRPKFEITVKNWGQTPAFLWAWTLQMTCEDLPEVPVYGGIAAGMPLEKQVIPGGGTFTLPEVGFHRQYDFSVDDATAVSEQRKPFTVYGHILYGDIFGNPLRRLKFCEVLLNIFGELNFQWTELFSDPPYVGTDLYPVKQKQEPEQAE
jgi:hypothetical protein